MKALEEIGRPVAGAVAGLVPALVLLLLLGACADEPEPVELTPEREARLIQRVTESWQAMERRDYGKVYEYTTPNYRKVFPKELFLQKFGYSATWELTGVEIVHYDADAAVASVAVGVMSMPTKPTSEASKALGALPGTVREKWFFIDGEWWKSAKI